MPADARRSTSFVTAIGARSLSHGGPREEPAVAPRSLPQAVVPQALYLHGDLQRHILPWLDRPGGLIQNSSTRQVSRHSGGSVPASTPAACTFFFM